ncbi:MAG: hypothetical protein KGI50_05675 [Patescibacteria group bacterium]|nr:hypothetical protein [Patescibacteria group bacterium]MDE2438879.1 hypothetical protein [Patescibacteria group bacterium]
MPVLLQYAINNGKIYLHEIWRTSIGDTLDIIEAFCKHPDGIVGFNLTFDWFHINKLYNVFRLCPRHWIPEDYIEEIACLEKQARDGVCVLPQKACDLFLHARKGVYQSTLDRKDIRIRRVPKELAQPLANEMNKRIQFNKLYFARRKEQLDNPWQVFDSIDRNKVNDPDFRDIVLKFSPSSGLKALAVDALGVNEDELLKFTDIAVHPKFNPEEIGSAPYAEAIGMPGRWCRTWPDVIQYHIDHWAYSTNGRLYAEKDIVYTRQLYEFFGRPESGDDDSELACHIAAARWKGFAVDIDKIKALRLKAIELSEIAPKSPGRVKDYIWPDLSEDEKLATQGSTGKVVLEEIKTWKLDNGDPHPAAIKAKLVLDARKAKKEIEIFDKIIQAGRLHASFKVIGTLSGRMSGADGLNPQAIKSTKEVRGAFPLAFEDEVLCGGDFESFEVCIAVAVYNDKKLEADLNSYGACPDCIGKDKSKCKGCNGTGQAKRKLHGLFGEVLYKMTYDEIVASKGNKEKDFYTDSKRGVFSQLYGGDYNTLMVKLGLDETTAKDAAERWGHRYPGIKKAQQTILNALQSMKQPGGIGTKVEWHDPADYVESLLGFKRYYTLENKICKVLFDLAESPPKQWTNLRIVVRRRDRDQSVAGAVRSAVFGAAFGIQSANVRSGTNHVIQSTGSSICKRTQRKLLELQPKGIHEWKVRCMNIHDELMVATKKDYLDPIEKSVRETVESFRPIIPMISIDWSKTLKSWADK